MIWLIFAMLLVLGVVALFVPYTVVGSVIQIVAAGIFVWIGIYRILAISKRMRRYQGI